MKTRLNVSVRGLFATPVAAMEVPDAEARNSELRAIILNKREQSPSVQVLIYPALDPRLTTESAKEFAEGYGLTTEDMRWSWRQYAPEEFRRPNPLVAPAQASSLRGLPPAIVVTAGFDILRDEGQSYAGRLSDAGVRTVPLHYEDSIHGFLWMAGRLEATTRMLSDVRDGLRRLWWPTPSN